MENTLYVQSVSIDDETLKFTTENIIGPRLMKVMRNAFGREKAMLPKNVSFSIQEDNGDVFEINSSNITEYCRSMFWINGDINYIKALERIERSSDLFARIVANLDMKIDNVVIDEKTLYSLMHPQERSGQTILYTLWRLIPKPSIPVIYDNMMGSFHPHIRSLIISNLFEIMSDQFFVYQVGAVDKGSFYANPLVFGSHTQYTIIDSKKLPAPEGFTGYC